MRHDSCARYRWNGFSSNPRFGIPYYPDEIGPLSAACDFEVEPLLLLWLALISHAWKGAWPILSCWSWKGGVNPRTRHLATPSWFHAAVGDRNVWFQRVASSSLRYHLPDAYRWTSRCFLVLRTSPSCSRCGEPHTDFWSLSNLLWIKNS